MSGDSILARMLSPFLFCWVEYRHTFSGRIPGRETIMPEETNEFNPQTFIDQFESNSDNEELTTYFSERFNPVHSLKKEDALDFVHPKKLKDGWDDDVCSECHRYLYD